MKSACAHEACGRREDDHRESLRGLKPGGCLQWWRGKRLAGQAS
jgi:hypothetical protein